jgi:hypothetical protein
MLETIIAFLMAILAMISPNTTEEIYPRTMVVSEINAETDTVILTDTVGYVWEFCGVEDWEVGDICSCIMDTNGTENITDDIIVDARYNGRLEELK